MRFTALCKSHNKKAISVIAFFLFSPFVYSQVLPQPVITALGPTTFCYGQSVVLSTPALAGVTYEWKRDGLTVKGPGSGNTYTANYAAPYTVTITQTSTGLSRMSVPVWITTESSLYVWISKQGPVSICNGSTAELTASNAPNYQWYHNGTLINGADSSVYRASQPGKYFLSATNSCGTAQDSIVVRQIVTPPVLNKPTLDPSKDTTLCYQSGLYLTTMRQEYVRYSWLKDGLIVSRGGEYDTAYYVSQPGLYSVAAFNICSGDSSISDQVRIGEKPKEFYPIAVTGKTNLCAGDSVMLTSPTSENVTWYHNWSPISNQQSVTASERGVYHLLVQSACSHNFDSVIVNVGSGSTVLHTPLIVSSGDSLLCPYMDIKLNTPGFDVGTNVLLQWFRNGIAIPNADDSTYYVYEPGEYMVKASGICSGDSVSSGIYNIVDAVTAPFKIKMDGPLEFCAGDSVILTSPFSSGNTWYINGSIFSYGQQVQATNTAEYKLRSNTGCGIRTDSVFANVNPGRVKPDEPYLYAIGGPGICTGGSVRIKAPADHDNSFTYQWFRDDALIFGITDSSLVVTSPGVYIVKSYSKCSGDSTASQPLTIQEVAGNPAKVNYSRSLTICSGDSIVFRSNSAIGNTWFRNDQVLASGPTFVATYGGPFILEVDNACGISRDTVTVNYNSAPLHPSTPYVFALDDTTLCSGGAAHLKTYSSFGLVNYQWLRDGIAIAGATDSLYAASVAGLYSVRSYSNCSGDSATSGVIRVTVNQSGVTARITSNRPLSFCSGDSVVLYSSATTGNKWYNGSTYAQSTASSYTAYWTQFVQLEVTDGCGVTYDSTNVHVADGPVKPYPPAIYSATDTILCSGSFAGLKTNSSPGNTALIYHWFRNGNPIPGATDSSYMAFVSGQYSVKAYSTCSGDSNTSRTITVTVNSNTDEVKITPEGPLEFCNGGSVVLNSTPGGSYQWYRNWIAIPGANQRQYTAIQSGTYYNLVGNPCGVSYNYDSVNVVVNLTVGITTVRATPSVLSPADHQLKTILLEYPGAASCPLSNCHVTVVSNEPEQGLGDGDLPHDWELVNMNELRLRAERSNSGAGRIYTIAVSCSDSMGNLTVRTTTVNVPKPDIDALIFQNPSSTEFRLLVTSALNTPIILKVYRANGYMVETRNNIAPNSIITLGGSYLPGYYYIELSQGISKKVIPIIKF